MRSIYDIPALRRATTDLRKAGKTIGFVPTMGYLHAGHMELVNRARAENDYVVASIFVNPLQFGPTEDLGRYPRDLERDASMLKNAGVDILFAPSVEEMYPRPMEAVVDVPEISRQLIGDVRPGHFAGVATVVCKLLNIVQPKARISARRTISSSLLFGRWWMILQFRPRFAQFLPFVTTTGWPSDRGMCS